MWELAMYWGYYRSYSYIWDILFFITVQQSEGPDYSCEVLKCRNSASVGEATCYTKLTFSPLVFLKVSYFHASHSCEPAKKTGLAKWKHVSDKDTGIFITSKIQKATIICLQEKAIIKHNSPSQLSTGLSPFPLFTVQHVFVGTPRKSIRAVYMRYQLARTT